MICFFFCDGHAHFFILLDAVCTSTVWYFWSSCTAYVWGDWDPQAHVTHSSPPVLYSYTLDSPSSERCHSLLDKLQCSDPFRIRFFITFFPLSNMRRALCCFCHFTFSFLEQNFALGYSLCIPYWCSFLLILSTYFPCQPSIGINKISRWGMR